MKTTRLRSVSVLSTVAVSLLVCLGARAQFPPLGDDFTPSLGQFIIIVNPTFQPMMVGYPGYSTTMKRVTSPVLYDPNTVIGRSAPLLDGSTADVSGVPVGTAGTVISESSYSVMPGGLGPLNTREVHTEIRTMNMISGGVAVRAGTLAPDQPKSAGEVESWSGPSMNPALDFPAQSFFDVFVDVDLPAGGPFPGAIGANSLYNDVPLLIQNTNLVSFPPQVVYIHGMSTAVPIKFRTTNPGFWTNGDTFGLLSLGGHDIVRTNDAATVAAFQATLAGVTEAPVEPAYSNWAPGLTVAGTNMIFPPKGDDSTPSLGMFKVAVNPAIQPLLAGYPGYDGAGRLTSPILYDPATIIGRSSPLLAGSPPDSNGVPVGTVNTMVGDSNFTLIPPLFEEPAGTREVHTQVRSLNMAGGMAVRAGTAAPGSPISVGEVESLSGHSSDPYWDFPAKSFFDIFVQVDLPSGGPITSGFTVTNSKPLIVQNNNLTTFPPNVVYIHGNSTAVPVMFTNSNPPFWNAGDTFGVLLLAGHGIGMDKGSSNDVANFQETMSRVPEQKVEPQYANWAPNLLVPLVIRSITRTNGTVQISGDCSPNSVLSLLASPTLGGSAPWANVGGATSGSNASFTLSHSPGTAPTMYYQVRSTR